MPEVITGALAIQFIDNVRDALLKSGRGTYCAFELLAELNKRGLDVRALEGPPLERKIIPAEGDKPDQLPV